MPLSCSAALSRPQDLPRRQEHHTLHGTLQRTEGGHFTLLETALSSALSPQAGWGTFPFLLVASCSPGDPWGAPHWARKEQLGWGDKPSPSTPCPDLQPMEPSQDP